MIDKDQAPARPLMFFLFVGLPILAMIITPLWGWYYGFTASQWVIAVAFLYLNGLSITGGYHRLWAHNAYQAHPQSDFGSHFGARAPCKIVSLFGPLTIDATTAMSTITSLIPTLPDVAYGSAMLAGCCVNTAPILKISRTSRTSSTTPYCNGSIVTISRLRSR